jgi:large subunit ribosomal protein L31e
MAKTETAKTIERTYTVPLRKEYRKVPRWRKTKKAVDALREFLVKHMKSEDVKLSKELNEHVWKHGIKNPPHHVKVNVTKDEKGVVMAELFGAKKKTVAPKKEVKKSKLAELKKSVAAKA